MCLWDPKTGIWERENFKSIEMEFFMYTIILALRFLTSSLCSTAQPVCLLTPAQTSSCTATETSVVSRLVSELTHVRIFFFFYDKIWTPQSDAGEPTGSGHKQGPDWPEHPCRRQHCSICFIVKVLPLWFKDVTFWAGATMANILYPYCCTKRNGNACWRGERLHPQGDLGAPRAPLCWGCHGEGFRTCV